MTIYWNRYHAFQTQNASQQARGHAFSEIVLQVDDALI